jgi:predicted MFS family arabinose efflux permease
MHSGIPCFEGSVPPTRCSGLLSSVRGSRFSFSPTTMGGPTAGMEMVLIQLVPCIVLDPFLGAFADRSRPSRVLVAGYGLQALSMACVAAAIALGAPALVVFLLAPLIAVSISLTRPPQAALLPAVVRLPEELTAANVMAGWTDGVAALLGPGIAGILLALDGAGAAVAAAASMSIIAMLLVAGVAGPAAAVSPGDLDDFDDLNGSEGRMATTSTLRSRARLVAGPIWAGARSKLTVAVGSPQLRVLLTLHTFYFLVIGSLDLLCVVLAENVLHMGTGGPGFLNSALGGGALLAGFVTAFLVGRRRLSNTLVVALSVAVVALACIGAVSEVAIAVLLIVVVGLSGAVFDITGRTLLQRSAPSDAVAGSFSILEGLMDLGLALGAVLVRIALAIGGVKAALFAPAVIAVVLIGGLWRRLREIDTSANIPQVEIQLLRSISIFAALPAPSLEGMARELEAMEVSSGTAVITEGESGDRYYAVADGELAISRDGQVVQVVSRGEGFGEIALIRDVPRQASVAAVTDVLLYSLQKEVFVQTVTGHVITSSRTSAVIAGHLGHAGSDGTGTGTGEHHRTPESGS